MYLDYFGLSEPPFRITPHTEFFFSGANRGATLEALLYAIEHDEGIVKVTGEVGSGKTMLCRMLVERLPKSVETIYLANPSLSRDEILHVIAADLQVESNGERLTILLRALQERLIKLYGAGRRVVVLIDEAHAMPPETLEEVRLLSNLESNRHKLLQIVLFGQPELDAHLALPSMRQLKERITHGFKLEPLVRSDVQSYVDFRLRAAGYRGPSVFRAPALRLIAQASQGLTRRINILADKSLLAAFAASTHEVTAKQVRAAIRDAEYATPLRLLRKWWLLAAGLAAGLALGLGVHFALQTQVAKAALGGLAADRTATPRPAGSGPAASAGSPAVSRSSAAAPALAAADTPGEANQTKRTDPGGQRGLPLALGKRVQERLDATQEWLKAADTAAWTIQLLTVKASDADAMEQFLERAAEQVKLDDLYVYGLRLSGDQYYAVTYGVYSTLEETISAMSSLPSSFKARRPFHRSIALMRRQNQQ